MCVTACFDFSLCRLNHAVLVVRSVLLVPVRAQLIWTVVLCVVSALLLAWIQSTAAVNAMFRVWRASATRLVSRTGPLWRLFKMLLETLSFR